MTDDDECMQNDVYEANTPFFEKEFSHRRCQKLPQNYAYAYSICACVRVRVCLFFELQLLLYYDVDSDAINLVVTLYEFK